MKRKPSILLVGFSLLVLSLLPMKPGYAASSAATAATATTATTTAAAATLPVTPEDTAIFTMAPHQLTAQLNQPSLTLDAQIVEAGPLLMRDKRLYFPLKWLEKAQVATVKWDAKTSSASVEFSPGAPRSYFSYRVKANSSKLYTYSNGALTEAGIAIPATFTQGGQLYVPVTLMHDMGINYSWSSKGLRLTWNGRDIKVLRPEWTTQASSVTFTALEDKAFGHVYLMQSYGDGGGMTSVIGGGVGNLSGTEKVIGDPISLNGKTYQRVQYSVDLRPGENPLRLYSNMEVYAPILVHRQIPDPAKVPIGVGNREEAWRIAFTKPSNGYLRVHVGDPIVLAGQVKVIHNPASQIPFRLTSYQNGDFEPIGDWHYISLDENLNFSDTITIHKPGSSLINICKPNVPGVIWSKWGEIVVEVER